jgi:peptide/nickel transport system permease protein
MRRRVAIPAIALGAIVLVALAAPLLPLPDPVKIDVAHRLAGPSPAHPLGQDEFGRDVLSRLIWGARVSLAVAFASSTLACVVGTALALVGGMFGWLAELCAVRSMDVVLCFPPLLLALLVVTLFGPGATTLVPVIALRAQDYVEAVRAIGAGQLRIILRTVLPNVLGPVLVQFSLAAAAAVVLESGLSFLGLGVVPPSPSWGLMIGAARSTMAQAPLLLLWPCLALSVTILAMNALCDALRDSLDPQGGS